MKRLHEMFATCGYIGRSPWMPGTLGSAAGLVLLAGRPAPFFFAFLILIIFFAGVRSADTVIAATGKNDPQEVVIDEVTGILITFFAVPLDWQSLLTGFILFRLFDIWKPFPIRRLEQLKGGWGVMADDAAAGIAANVILHLLLHYWTV